MEGGGIHYLLTLLLAVNNKIVQCAQHHEKSRQYYKQDPYDLAGGIILILIGTKILLEHLGIIAF